jgi:hypothetical protein
MINAAEVSIVLDNLCVILVQWDPPANSDASDIDQYIIYVPSRNFSDDISSNSTVTTFTEKNCGDDDFVLVAAVNRFGCVGMNSSEVQPVLLDIPTVPTEDGSATDSGSDTTITEGGSASASSKHLHVIIN